MRMRFFWYYMLSRRLKLTLDTHKMRSPSRSNVYVKNVRCCRFLLLQKLLAQASEIFTDVTTDMNLMRTLQSCGR